jgi:Glycosyl hydrolase family 76
MPTQRRAAAVAITALMASAALPVQIALSPSAAAATAAVTAPTHPDDPAPSTATPAVTAHSTDICNKYCDGRDPALAPTTRTSVSTTIYSRQITLYFDDTDAMGWAAISNGSPTDEVWLERSFDGGVTWSTDGNLGDTTIPTGDTQWRTLMYNVDNWSTDGVGALRACGKAGNRTEVACTAWARTTWNAGSPATAAATALMMNYNTSTGLFNTTGWWNSANALTAIIDNIRITGMGSYEYAIAETYQDQINSMNGNFTDSYMDDTGWWGLAWVDAYDLTGNTQYLGTAEADANYMYTYWDSVCGGGIWWNTSKSGKNAISNSLYLELNAALHNRISGDTTYLNRAKAEWAWFSASGLINSSDLVNDGLTSSCQNNGATTWTYNQGVPLAGLVELYRATGTQSLLTEAENLANASTSSTYLNPGGILQEPCEPSNGCGADGTSFKGVYVRDLGVLNNELSNHPYSTYLTHQESAAYADDRTPLDSYGLHWAGPVDSTDAARQQSALDLQNAAL